MAVQAISTGSPPTALIVAAPYAPAGPITSCTSDATANIVGAAIYTFPVNETNLGFLPGMRVRAAAQANPNNWVEGVVTSFDTVDLVINADLSNGAGTFTGWNINITGQPGKTGAKGDTGAVGPQGPAGGLVNPNVILTGTPTAPTAGPADVSLQLANTTWVHNLLIANYQPLDSDLTSLAAAASIGVLYYRSAAGVWAEVTIGSNMSFVGGTLSATLTGTAPINSPAFTGDPTRVTGPAPGDSDLSIPTTAWVQGEIALKAPLASPTFTGIVAVPTPAGADDSTAAANTTWVQARLGNFQPLDGDLTALAAFSASGVMVWRKADSDWQPVVIGANLAFDVSSGTLNASGGSGSGGIDEAPTDGLLYGRQSLGWVQAVSFTDLAAYATLASPAFSGTPRAPTAAPSTNTDQLATTAFTTAAIAGKADTSALAAYAPLASPALTGSPTSPTPTPQSDSSGRIATTSFVAGAIAPLAPKASPVFTGDPQAPTATLGDNDTSIATTAFVQQNISGRAILYSSPQSLTKNLQAIALANIGAAQNVLINGMLVESHAGNAATYAVKTFNLADPSATDPVLCIFGDGSALTITAALSVTITAGATLGAVNNIAFRLWFLIFNDAGTPRLAVRQNYIVGGGVAQWRWLPSSGISNVVAISAAADAFNASYGSVAVTNGQCRAVAFADYDSGLATAGNWAVAPTRIMLVNHQTPMPGSVLSTLNFNTASQTLLPAGGALGLTALALNASLTSPANLVRCAVSSDVYLNCAAGTEIVSARVYRSDTTPIGVAMQSYGWAATVVLAGVIYSQVIYDKPNTTAATLYRLCGAYMPGNAGDVVYLPWVGASMELSEIMM